MSSANDFQSTLALIDARLAELEPRHDEAKERLAAVKVAAAAVSEEADTGEEISAQDDISATEINKTAADLSAGVENIAQRIELLHQLRVVVQRRATLAERLIGVKEEVTQRDEQLANLDEQGVALEPPFPVSLLDQQLAELVLTQASEEVAETRLKTATRRMAAITKELGAVVSARRAARDQLTQAESDTLADAERELLADALELARLRELLTLQELAASEHAVELARHEDRLAEMQQELLAARRDFLKSRAQLSDDMLDQRLADLKDTEESISAQIKDLQRRGDQAESALYQARQGLITASDDANRAVLEEWVAARQAELDAARSGVDSLTTALTDIDKIGDFWQLRFELMQDPEPTKAAQALRDIIAATTLASTEKDEIESRLNALRAIQLAQARHSSDPTLSDEQRKAAEVRSEALDLAERHGRELLETKDELLALLQGMRHQLEDLIENEALSLQLLQARETLTQWWDAELIVIDDQSIRVRELAMALAMFVVVLFAVSFVRVGAYRALSKSKRRSESSQSGDFYLAWSAVAGNTSQFFVLIAAFYVAMVFSGLASPTVKAWLWSGLIVAFYFQLAIWANAAAADYFNRRRSRRELRDPSTVTGYGVLMVFVRVGIWITMIVSLLAYFKYPIAGLLGALGVGSVAVGFALQNILGDVFSSMAIILDKPFRVGDFVKAGDTLGVIELIGVKTTRVRSLSGEQVVLSNSDLLNSRIHNFRHFKERRVSFRIGVVYQTPRALIERIPEMIREAIEEQPITRFDRAHFFEFGDFSLNFEIVYYVLAPDYDIYMDMQQGINLGIHRRFEDAGIDFAYPTQELILRRAPGSSRLSKAGVSSQ
ncbi:mechanosensitive ion channel domain-containing protein [Thiorhodovibrio winogradskyi]|nr:mechanosensitive ion channel domain-containing protein [Thiorhodovibrio winogradskyi]